MSNFRLTDEEEPQKPEPGPVAPPQKLASTPPQPDIRAAAEQYEAFLSEEDAPAPPVATVRQGAQNTTPNVQSQAQIQSSNAAPRVNPVSAVRPVNPVNPVARAARSTSPVATTATVAANATAAAVAASPATAPMADAASVSASGPSDNFSAGLSDLGASGRRILDACEPAATWVARVTFPLLALSFAYLLAALFLGGAASLSTRPTTAEGVTAASTLIHNLTLASTIFCYAAIGLTLAFAILAYDDNRVGAIIAGIGILLFFGSQPVLKGMIGVNAGSIIISYWVQLAAKFLLAVGLFKGVFDLFNFLFGLPDRIKAKNATVGMGRQVENKQLQIAKQANMASPCWKLPFCREAIRSICPAFLAKKTCWKFGRGCYCDEEMIGRMVRGESIEAIKAPTKMSNTKPPCGQCYIYLEHQTHKFRMISPLVLPATILICFAAWPAFSAVFGKFNAGLVAVFSSLSFSSANLTPDAIKTSAENVKEVQGYAADPAQVAAISMVIMGGVLGFFVLIYLSKFVEWAIFKAKW